MMTTNAPERAHLTPEQRELAETGRQAWEATKKNFSRWMEIAETVAMLRDVADKIGGKFAFKNLLMQCGLDEIDKAIISQLEKVAKHAPEVYAWHSGLKTLKQKVDWASPKSILRHCPVFNADKAPTPKKPKAAPIPERADELQERVVELQQELDATRGRVKELETGATPDGIDWMEHPAIVARKVMDLLHDDRKRAKALSDYLYALANGDKPTPPKPERLKKAKAPLKAGDKAPKAGKPKKAKAPSRVIGGIGGLLGDINAALAGGKKLGER